jgi:hypothetical protein
LFGWFRLLAEGSFDWRLSPIIPKCPANILRCVLLMVPESTTSTTSTTREGSEPVVVAAVGAVFVGIAVVSESTAKSPANFLRLRLLLLLLLLACIRSDERSSGLFTHTHVA